MPKRLDLRRNERHVAEREDREIARISSLEGVPTSAPAILAPVQTMNVAMDRHPAATYLSRLSPGSRRTMREALDTVAGILSLGRADARSLPWAELRYQHTAAARAALIQKYSPSSVNKTLSALRGVLREAWRLGQISAEERERASDLAPARGQRLPRGRALGPGELRALFTACAADTGPSGSRDAALLAVLYGAGLRRSEAAALDRSDYDSASGELRVRSGKGQKQRLVFVSNGGKAAVESWLNVRGPADGPLFNPVSKGRDGRVAPRRMTAQAVYAALLRRAVQGGVARFSPHDLRRTFVGDLLDAGADISTVQALAGHASPTTTTLYDRRPDEVKRRAAHLLHVPFVAREPRPAANVGEGQSLK